MPNAENLIKNLVLPMAVSVFTGVAASYVSVNVTLAIMETRISYIESNGERRLADIEEKVDSLTTYVTELKMITSRNEQRIIHLEPR